MAALTPLTSWELYGRVAVRTADQGGQASLRWVRQPDRYTIDLTGPLGRGLLRLSQNEQGAVLIDSERNRQQAADAETLLYDNTGWRIPLAGLGYWVRGIPVPGLPQLRELDVYGRLSSLEQLGWRIHFEDYESQAGYDLPRRLTLTLAANGQHDLGLPGDAGAPVEARLVIERWTRLR